MADQKLGTTYVDIEGRKAPLFKALDASKKKVDSATKKMAKRIGALQKRMGELGKSMTLKVTAPIVAAFTLATREFMRFDAAMRNVNVIARQSEEQFRKTTEAVLELSQELGKSPVDLANALYNINSAGFTAAKGLVILRQSVIAAKAGISDTATAAKTITSILNAYGLGVASAADVSDILFKTIEKGVTTFPELGSSLGNVISTAAAAKIPFDQVAAALATMTKGGISTTEAVTALNMMILGLIKPSGEMQKALEKAGHASGAALIEFKGLGGVLEFMQEATGGTAEGAAKLGLRVRALKAVLSLTRNEGKAFAEDLSNIANKQSRMGSTTAALKEQQKSLQFQWDKMKASVSVLAIKIGRSLAPVVRDIIGLIKTLSQAFSGLSEGGQKSIVWLGLLVAAIGPALLGVVLMTKALIAMKVVLLFLAANPIIFVTAIAIAAVLALKDSIFVMNKHMAEAVEITRQYNQAMGRAQTHAQAFDATSEAVIGVTNLIGELEDAQRTYYGHAREWWNGNTKLVDKLRDKLDGLIKKQEEFATKMAEEENREVKKRGETRRANQEAVVLADLKKLQKKEAAIKSGFTKEELDNRKDLAAKKKKIEEDTFRASMGASKKAKAALIAIEKIKLAAIKKADDKIVAGKKKRVADEIKSTTAEFKARQLFNLRKEREANKPLKSNLNDPDFLAGDEKAARTKLLDWRESEEEKQLKLSKKNLAELEKTRATLHVAEQERRADERAAMIGFGTIESLFNKAQEAGTKERFAAPQVGFSKAASEQLKKLDEQIKLKKQDLENQQKMLKVLGEPDIGVLG